MTSTPPGMTSSWVDLSREIVGGGGYFSPMSPRRTTPPLPLGSDHDYMRMLREAQKETSNRSSARVSPITSALMSQSSTCRNSPCMSPKSPPNSPRTEVADFSEQFQGVYINRVKEAESSMTDFMWDWSSTPSICPPKDWKYSSQTSGRSSAAYMSPKDEASGKPRKSPDSFSRKVVYTFFLTNIISLIIGAGIGMWIYRKSDKSMEILL